MFDNEEKKVDVPTFVGRHGSEEDRVTHPEVHAPQSSDSYLGKHAYRREPVNTEEKNDYYEAPQPEEPKEKRGLSPILMVLVVLALIMAIVAVVLGIIHMFGNETPKTTMPATTVETTPTPTPSVAPSESAQPTTSEPTSSETTTPTPTPETVSSETVIGRYVLNSIMNVRSGPGTSNGKVTPPSAYADYITDGMLKSGTIISVYEEKEDGYSVWGRIGKDAWVCLEDENAEYATKQ